MPDDENANEMAGFDLSALISDAPTNVNTAREGDEEPKRTSTQMAEPNAPASNEADASSDENAEPDGSGDTAQPGEEGKAQGEDKGQQKQQPAPAAKPDDTLSTLQKLVQDQAAQIRQLTGALAQQVKQPSDGGKPKTEEPKAPKYNFGIPDSVIEGFSSEDPATAKAALQHLVSSLANRLWDDFQVEIGNLRKEIPQIAATTSKTLNTQEAVTADYYGKFPNHRAAAPIVMQVAQAVAAEWGAVGKLQGWTPEFRDEVGNRMNALLAGIIGAPPAQPRQPAKRPEPKKPSFTTGHGGAGAANGAAKSPFLDSIGI